MKWVIKCNSHHGIADSFSQLHILQIVKVEYGIPEDTRDVKKVRQDAHLQRTGGNKTSSIEHYCLLRSYYYKILQSTPYVGVLMQGLY